MGMPISVTCQCGARLEIDEKFLGKEVPCPDCGRLLPTQAPAKPPPLDMPNHRRKSGLAVLSLSLALVFGWVPVIGPLAAVLAGLFSLRQISKYPNRLEGANFARAGIILGAVAFLIGPAAWLSPMFILYTDQFIRELKYAGKITYPKDGEVLKNDLLDDPVEFKKADGWATWTVATGNGPTDLLFLVNPYEDAFITCFNVQDINVQAPEDKQKKVLEAVYKSQLINVVGELRNRNLDREGTVIEKEKKLVENDKIQELVVELRLARIERKLLIHYPAKKDHTFKVLVGACRRSDFEHMRVKFAKIFETIRPPLTQP